MRDHYQEAYDVTAGKKQRAYYNNVMSLLKQNKQHFRKEPNGTIKKQHKKMRKRYVYGKAFYRAFKLYLEQNFSCFVEFTEHIEFRRRDSQGEGPHIVVGDIFSEMAAKTRLQRASFEVSGVDYVNLMVPSSYKAYFSRLALLVDPTLHEHLHVRYKGDISSFVDNVKEGKIILNKKARDRLLSGFGNRQ